jgi:hypothetical protein
MIRLRCHKKKWKRCRKESALLPDTGTYTCRRDTTFVSQHIITQHDRHGWRGTFHTARRSCTTWRAVFPNAVIFCRKSSSFCGLCLYTSDLTYPHTKKSGGFKSGEFASHGMGPSRPHQWFFYVSPKNSRTVRAQCGGTLHGHPSRSYSNCSEIRTLTYCIQRFTFLISQTDHSVYIQCFRNWIHVHHHIQGDKASNYGRPLRNSQSWSLETKIQTNSFLTGPNHKNLPRHLTMKSYSVSGLLFIRYTRGIRQNLI